MRNRRPLARLGTTCRSIRHLGWCALGLIAIMTGCEWRKDGAVARVDGVGISRADVVVELRGMLWRRGESWEGMNEETRQTRRREALERCVEARLLAGLAKEAATEEKKSSQAAEQEFQQFLKQFEPPDDWKNRLEIQEVSEVQMRERIETEVTQGGAIEAWLQGQEAGSREQGAGNENPREKEAREWFAQHRELWRVPERARVSHLFLTGHDETKPDRTAEITELHRRLTAGEVTLETLAPRFSEDERSKRAGGNLGWIERERVPEDFAEKVFAQPLRKLSAPFRTKLGWHVVIVHEKKAGRWAEFEEVKNEVMARLDQAWREETVKRLVEELRGKAKVVVDEEELGEVEPGE